MSEELDAAYLAEAFGESGVQVRLERFQDPGRPAFVRRGQELLEVGVSEAPDGLAIEMETAGDGADGPACGDKLLDVSVAVPGPVDARRPG
ncbi:hypothetical protein ABZY19_22245 [Streptomyces sp. NPDC006475]|uniref:hypothetical protein n=1 Tax=Streptomyces sp. NPDC006475 TaxID=3155719 RepID=UPI0033A6D4F8